MKQAPRRTCVGCRTTRDKPELVRVAATPDGVVVDPDQRLPGRGAYVCPDPNCLDALERTGGEQLRRALRTAEHRTIPVALSELHRRLDPHGRIPEADAPPAGPTPRRSTTTRSSNA